MIERLELIEKRMNEIDGLLMDPSVLSDIKKSMELSKERANIIDSYEAYQKYKKILSDLVEADEFLKDGISLFVIDADDAKLFGMLLEAVEEA